MALAPRLVTSFSSRCLSALNARHFFFATITLSWRPRPLDCSFSSHQVREDSPPVEPLDRSWRCTSPTSLVRDSSYMQPPQLSQLRATLTKQEERIVELRQLQEDDRGEIEELSGMRVTW